LSVKNVAVVKAITLLLSSLAAILPIVYGLAAHGWDVRSMLAPSYTPPKVDFRLEFSGFKLDKGGLYMDFKVTNLGEVKVMFEGFNASAFGPDGKVLAPAVLDKPIISLPGSTENMILKIEVDEVALSRFASYLMEGRDRIRVEVRGEAIVRVFGSKVTAPLSTSFEIGLADVLKGLR
jgi:hypothetical protein